VSRLEFFFDLTSPWTYLAFSRIEGLCREAGAELVWKPILVGGVFNAVNPAVYASREEAFATAARADAEAAAGREGTQRLPGVSRARYYHKDLGDWARLYGLSIRVPPFHPARAVEAMRGAHVALEAGCLVPYASGVFEAYFGSGLDVSRLEVLVEIAGRAGLDPRRFPLEIARPEVKKRLRDTTEELVERGGFGSPTFIVDGGDLYFGNDRLPLVAAALSRPAPGRRGRPGR
jgi:2-hydroxychromene-2-carboxylate isomerase